jgi:hypothetical protein
MKESEATEALGILLAGFPQEALEPATGEVWVKLLTDLDADATMAVIYQWIKTEPKFPAMAQLRQAVRQYRSRQESERVRLSLSRTAGPLEVPAEVKEWQSSVGWD